MGKRMERRGRGWREREREAEREWEEKWMGMEGGRELFIWSGASKIE